MPKEFMIIAGKIYTPKIRISNGAILVRDGRIAAIKTRRESKADRSLEILDFSEDIIVPGFIDMHIHGISGACTADAEPKSIEKMSEALVRHGVTSFLPALHSCDPELLTRSLKAIASLRDRQVKGARLLGIYLEGPFVSPRKPGAMNEKYFKNPSRELFDEIYNGSDGMLKLMTVAPELPGAIPLIKYVLSRGVRVALGHTDAGYEAARAAIGAGASHVTHLFNAMRTFHHRDPGIVGAVLEDPEVSVELIADLVHLSSTAIRLTYMLKPKDKVVCITDALAAELSEGIHQIADREILVKGDAAYLMDGKTLAGSVLTLDKALRNLVFDVGIPLEDALRFMTINPANILGERDLGEIKVGARADLTVLDKSLRVVAAFIDGVLIYRREHDS